MSSSVRVESVPDLSSDFREILGQGVENKLISMFGEDGSKNLFRDGYMRLEQRVKPRTYLPLTDRKVECEAAKSLLRQLEVIEADESVVDWYMIVNHLINLYVDILCDVHLPQSK